MFIKFDTKEDLMAHGNMRVTELQHCKFARSRPVKSFLSKGCQLWQIDSLYAPGDQPFVELYKDIFMSGVNAGMKEVNLADKMIKYYSPDKIEGIINRAKLLKPDGYEMLIDWLKEGTYYNGFLVI